jgi:CRP-like cAMP-binding protein
MDFSLIINNISNYITLSKKEEFFFTSLLQVIKLKRKQLLLHEGDVCKNITFVVSGCLKCYTIDKKGNEHVVSFAPADWWTGDLYSLITQKPCTINISAIEETEIIQLAKFNQEILYQKVPKFERFFRILSEKSLAAFRQRLIDDMSLRTEERYKNFCQKYPTILNKLPQKEIATYLGVTPEFLSKMRTQMFRKK